MTTKTMDWRSYNKTREGLGMTYEQLARAVGRHWNVIARRCRGELPITTEADLSMRWLVNRQLIAARAAIDRKRAK